MTRQSLSCKGMLALTCAIALVLGIGVSLASANTNVLMMPDRQALKGTPVVVWGNSKLATTACTLDFGDSTPVVNCNGADRSYIAATHTYTAAATYTATLTVNGESESAQVTVLDPANPVVVPQLRGIGINMAIEDGLRYLYRAQDSRSATFLTNKTSWSINRGDPDYYLSYSSLVVLAFQNHGHVVTNDPTKDIYQAVVQRGLNFIFDNLSIVALGSQVEGPPGTFGGSDGAVTNNPCVGVPADADQCKGLGRPPSTSHSMYASSVITLAVAGSGALTRTVDAGLGAASGGFVAGRTYGDVLQRQVNTIVWGMNDGGNDGSHTCAGFGGTFADKERCRGGFGYALNSVAFGQYSDGSTAGWGVLALLDAEAAGAMIPAFVRNEVRFYLAKALNPNGSLKYQVYMQDNVSNFPKTGVGLQVMKFANRPLGDSAVQGALSLLSTNWNTGFGNDALGTNKGLAYGMFNAFKGLKLYGVQTLGGVGRPAGPGSIPANDWHADYQDWLVANQQSPTSTSGGQWSFGWSCCDNDTNGSTAVAELILAPVALVLPANLTLSPGTATNNITQGQTSHTVTATATAANGAPVQAATVTFTVLTGPHAGVTGTGITDSNGQATFTYTGTTGGTDTIRASIGNLQSNSVTKLWITNQPPVAQCQDVTTPADASCQGTATAGQVDAGSSDPDGDALTLSLTPVPPYGLGGNAVTLNVDDGQGHTATCPATVTVVDQTPPAITCPAAQTVECTSPAGASVNVGAPTATDNCSVTSTGCSPASGTFAIGTTAVACSATDGSGNSAGCQTAVTVVDTTAPGVSCVPSVNPSGNNIPAASKINEDGFYKVGASDVCTVPGSIVIRIGGYVLAQGETIKITQARGQSGARLVNTMGPLQIKHFQVGPGDAVLTATDAAGNTTSVTCLVPPPPK